jgi:NADP-dependent 3-hydroxy acid dehydrogenase YdfG
VRGGSSGIGLAVAQNRWWHEPREQSSRRVTQNGVKQAATLDGKAKGHTLDLSNERNIQNFFQRIGDFDHLVFTAGDRLQLNELVATDLGDVGAAVVGWDGREIEPNVRRLRGALEAP